MEDTAQLRAKTAGRFSGKFLLDLRCPAVYHLPDCLMAVISAKVKAGTTKGI